MKRRYEIHIDNLVLPRSAVGTRQIRAAIERELARSVEAAAPTTSLDVSGLEAAVGPAAHPGAIGDKLARAMRRKLMRG